MYLMIILSNSKHIAIKTLVLLTFIMIHLICNIYIYIFIFLITLCVLIQCPHRTSNVYLWLSCLGIIAIVGLVSRIVFNFLFINIVILFNSHRRENMNRRSNFGTFLSPLLQFYLLFYNFISSFSMLSPLLQYCLLFYNIYLLFYNCISSFTIYISSFTIVSPLLQYISPLLQ